MLSDGGRSSVASFWTSPSSGILRERLLEVALGLRPEADLQVEARGLAVDGPVLRVELQRGLDHLDSPPGLARDPAADEREVVQGLRVLPPVVDGEVELLERGGEVPFAVGLDPLGEVDLRDGRGVERRAAGPLVEVEVVRLAALRRSSGRSPPR